MPLRLDIKRKLTTRTDRVKCVDLHPTEPWVLSSLYNGIVDVWNHETRQLTKTFEVCDLPVRSAKFVPRKNWVITGSDDMQVRVFNYNTLERVHAFEAHSDYVRCIAVHPTQPYILTSSDDMLIKLWNWDKQWACQQVFEGHSHYVMQIVINPKDNNTFASASLDRTVKVWQLGSSTPNFTLEGHEKGVNCVDYYHGGDKPYLISGADDRYVKIWDYQNKTCVQTLEGHAQNVTAVCFHPELPIVLTGSEDGTVRIWHAGTYRLESCLNYGLERVWTIASLKGSNYVSVGYDEGSVLVKVGREEPAVSMDANGGKLIWAKHSELQQANLKAMGEDTVIKDGERLPLAVKDMGSCEIYPQTIAHNPNGRFVVVCGDGEYIIYTAMALRNKAFGSAQEFVWAQDSSEYAIRENSSTVKVFKNFKERKNFKPDFGAEGIFGGFLLGVRSSSGLGLYDWESLELIRRIDIQPKHVFWSESGELVCLATEDGYFILKYNQGVVEKARQDKQLLTEDGIEDSFDMDNGYTFHLQEINHNTEICSNKDVCDDTATSISSYSNYKQRIDAMFDDSRSILSDMSRSNKKLKLPMNVEMCKERVFANNIQEKIEKMFEEISINGLQRQNSTMIRPGQNDEKSSISRHDFLVTYLGSKPLLDKNVSLMSLQDPLKELYFEYKRNPPKDQANVLTISKEGLKIKISEKEKLNPFPTIAVWASVKLSLRMTSTTREYAFLPLITDPDGVDKNLLFRELKSEDFQEQINDDNQSPIFAVVMKNITMNKQLECHGFICRSSEEAIVIAANLYQALMKKLKRKKEHKEVQKIKKESDDSVVEVPEPKPKVKVKKQAPPVPERSPKTPEPIVENEKKEEEPPQTQSEKTDTKPDEKIGRISQRRGSVPVNTHNEPARTLRRTVSDRGSNGIMVKNHSEGGDILTKVAIPRSRSFLNANGPHSRYSGRNKTNPKNELVSPLGLKELFNEFRLHEGLESMDDILNAIIDAEGMSFNDLKPIYKEFLLKLAVTLTKDELYQRSKTIMRRQKKRSRNCSFRKKAFMSSIGLNKLFRKRLGKSKSPRPTNLEFTSIVFQSTSKQFESNLPNIKKRKSNSFRVKRRQSSRRRLAKRLEKAKNKNISTTSEDSDFFQPVRNANDSGGGPNRASSGYFSCSECSCDSENCTCTRTDKCYCTLGHKKSYNEFSSDESRFCTKKKWNFHPNADKEPEDSLRSCSCDTETCGDSGKCYCTPNKNKWIYGKKVTNLKGVCQTPHLHQREKLHNGSCRGHVITGFRKPGESLFDQLKEQGFAASDTTISRAASPINWQPNERNVKQKMRLKPATSVEQKTSKEFLLPVCAYPNHFLKEIQNTPDRQNYFDNARHSCIRASDMGIHKRDVHSCGRRQYSSMRCRSDFLEDLTNLPPLHRSVSYRTKNLFSSVRSKHSCDSIMNHIKFPNCANSSLRFTRRMDVYNSFSENKRFNRRNDLICQYKENRRGIQEQALLSDDSDIFYHGNKNLQRLDYNIFTKPERCDSRISKKKVLVVSARDPKGKVLYMGTSNRCESSLKNRKNYPDNNSATGSEALAVKKSAEIAALFSDVTSKPKLILDYAKDQKHNNRRARPSSFRSTNLENTLGYLP